MSSVPSQPHSRPLTRHPLSPRPTRLPQRSIIAYTPMNMPSPLPTHAGAMMPLGPRPSFSDRRRPPWLLAISLLLHVLALLALLTIPRRPESTPESAPSYELMFDNGGGNVPPTSPDQAQEQPRSAPASESPPSPVPEPAPPTPESRPTPDAPPIETPAPMMAPSAPPLPEVPTLPADATPVPAPIDPAPPPPLPQALPPPEPATPPAEPAPVPQPSQAPQPAPQALEAPRAPTTPEVRLEQPAEPPPPPPLVPNLVLPMPPPPLPPPLLPTPPPPRPRVAPPSTAGTFANPMDLNLGPARLAAPRSTAARGSVASRSMDFSTGAPKSGPNKQEAFFSIRAANIGADWQQGLRTYWLAHRYYPRQAAETGQDGSVDVVLTINRLGRVQGVEVKGKSGSPFLDMAAVAVWRNAQLPPLPIEVSGETISIPITINYILLR